MSSPIVPTMRSTVLSLARDYDVFLVDQFGTLHDGMRPYAGAAAALRALREAGARVVLLSNSGKRVAPNAARLTRMGIPPESYDLFITSGEVAWRMLRDGHLAPPGARRCLLLSRGTDGSPLEGLDLVVVSRAEDADLIVIAGSEGERITLDDYRALLAPAAARGLPALCLNPDMVMLTRAGPAFGGGRIARLYEALGGRVRWIGKPYPEMYDVALAAMGAPDRARVVGVGDSIEHDVAGARRAGCAAALVLTGIIAGATPEEAVEACEQAGVMPDVMLGRFA